MEAGIAIKYPKKLSEREFLNRVILSEDSEYLRPKQYIARRDSSLFVKREGFEIAEHNPFPKTENSDNQNSPILKKINQLLESKNQKRAADNKENYK